MNQTLPSGVVNMAGQVDREEDLLVFGRIATPGNDNNDKGSSSVTSTMSTSLSSFVGDTMTQLVDDALKKGVASLHLMRGNDEENNGDNDNIAPSPAEAALIQRLTNVYYRNIDIIELYADHHIFTLDMYPPTRRQKIVQAFHQLKQQRKHQKAGENNGVPTISSVRGNEHKSSPLDDEAIVAIPSQDDIPTLKQMEALEEDIEQLHSNLNELKVERREWMVKCQGLEQVHANTEKVAQIMQKSSQTATTAVDQSVTAVIMGKQGLEQLHARAIDLLQELDHKIQPRLTLPVTIGESCHPLIGTFGKENRSKKRKLSLTPDKIVQQSRSLIQAPPEGMEMLRSLIRKSNE